MSYLILHKVRGEPAFDVADKLQIGDEEGWIIPTSGHRAYPIVVVPLDELINNEWDALVVKGLVPMRKAAAGAFELDPDWPDHYPEDKGGALPSGVSVMSIISKLMPQIKRRV